MGRGTKLLRFLAPAAIPFGFLALGCAELETRPFALLSSPQPDVPLYAKPSNIPKITTSESNIRAVNYQEPIEQGPPITLPGPTPLEPSGPSPVDPLRPRPAPVVSDAPIEIRPRTISEALNPNPVPDSVIEGPAVLELDLTSALAIAAGQNPEVAFAAARYREALARHDAAKVLWLPSINAGMSFNHHDGLLQASDGRMQDVSRMALQAGLGVQAIGAGSPMVPGVFAVFDTSSALFDPKIEAHATSARSAAISVTTLDVLLETSLVYLELLRATQQVRIAEETQANAQRLADLTATFAEEGEGAIVDADRARAALTARRNDVIRAQESVQVATVRLAELLRVDPSVPILPQEPTIVPVDLVAPGLPLPELVSTGLTNRPELAEASELINEAVARYRREKFSPWLPSVLMGVSETGFGGGLGGNIDEMSSRFDFDIVVYWNVRNLGFGEKARRDETRALYDQARARQVRQMDQVAREVAEASARVQSRRAQIDIAREGVQAATQALERDFARIREGEGLPIEVLQSLVALDEARTEYLQVVVSYNESQFRLQRALGWPIR